MRRPDLLLFGCIEAVNQEGRALPRQHLRHVGFMRTVHLPDLFGPPLLRGFPVFGGNGVWINQLLGKALGHAQRQGRKNQNVEKQKESQERLPASPPDEERLLSISSRRK